MSKYLSEIVKQIVPYVPGEQPKDKKYIKLNTNENPYQPSKNALDAIYNSLDCLNLYPEPTTEDLREELAEYNSLKKEQVFVGNGSDEVLAFAYMAFFNPGDTILFPDITYSFYPVYSGLFKINYELVDVEEDFSLKPEAFSKENNGIIFPNPNAPTGKLMDLSDVEQVLKNNINNVVIIDEAYIDFGGESAVKLIDKYPNLLVTQTLSKSRSLAGLRVGFAFGSKELIDGLNRIKNSINSYTVDTLAMNGALESIKDVDYFKETTKKIIDTRTRITQELKDLGFKVIDSSANFVFITHKDVVAEKLFNNLKQQGILVRYFNSKRVDNYLRVSIGTDSEMNEFLKTLEQILK